MTTRKKIEAPNVEIISRFSGATRGASPRLVQKIIRTWNMKKRYDQIKAELDILKEEVRRDLMEDDTVIIKGVCKAVVQVRNSYDVVAPVALRELLGDRFEDLVTPTIKFELEPKFKEMLTDPNDALGKLAREYVKPKSTASLTLMADSNSPVGAK